MTQLPLIYRGSVKDIHGTQTPDDPLVFAFSDRYSVFDWGEMPDRIEDKGRALAFMAWAFFDFLQQPKTWQDWQLPTGMDTAVYDTLCREGARTHALGLSDEQGNLQDRDTPTTYMAVERMNVMPPKSSQQDGALVWDYSAYQSRPVDTLVPLEVIFRFGVPEGSSLLKRTADPAYCKVLGLDKAPVPGDLFERPIIEMSTKLENYDRYLSEEQASEIAGLSAAECRKLKTLTAIIAARLKDLFERTGLQLWDGKLEFAFVEGAGDERDFKLIDSIGPDEIRLTCNGVQLSKECLRSVYRDTAWHQAVERAKQLADDRGVEDWKSICQQELKQTPPPLPAEAATSVAMLYKSCADALSKEIYGSEVFGQSWPLDAVAASLSNVKKQARAA
ncbi:MAG: phosphoribosylaminoimidazolesuccinocarboxamide synthase [Pseudomonadota bacterium]